MCLRLKIKKLFAKNKEMTEKVDRKKVKATANAQLNKEDKHLDCVIIRNIEIGDVCKCVSACTQETLWDQNRKPGRKGTLSRRKQEDPVSLLFPDFYNRLQTAHSPSLLFMNI